MPHGTLGTWERLAAICAAAVEKDGPKATVALKIRGTSREVSGAVGAVGGSIEGEECGVFAVRVHAGKFSDALKRSRARLAA